MKRVRRTDMSWHTDMFMRDGIFSDLDAIFNIHKYTSFPTPHNLTNIVREQNTHFRSLNCQFINQNENFDWEGQYYEEIIYTKSLIPTREENWHDFFNAMIWGLFPNTKKLLNKLHAEDIEAFGQKQRTKQRDAITLFDECGIVLAYESEQDKIALQQHLWLDSFWRNRDRWFNQIRPFIFGHALYEMSLSPFIGLTAKAYFIKVSDKFWNFSLDKKYQILDALLVKQISEQQSLQDNSNLSPLPLLGVPDWYPDNNQQHFYENTDYFRPKRKSTKAA